MVNCINKKPLTGAFVIIDKQILKPILLSDFRILA